MSGKRDKKIRQYARRYANGFMKDIIRPKPGWVPYGIWWWLVALFINIQEEKINEKT